MPLVGVTIGPPVVSSVMAVRLLWLLIVSFADSSAAGKQPAVYPDPGLIQDVDKNERIYGGAPLLRGQETLRVPRAFGGTTHRV